LVINTTSLLAGIYGIPYSSTLLATGGNVPYTWSISSGALPTGLSLTTAGVITGTPTALGTSAFVVKVTDSSTIQLNATQPLTLVIGAANCGPPAFSCARTDRTTTFTAAQITNMCPPPLGTATCTPGVNGQNLINTGWVYGRNTIFTDPNFNNIQGVRLVDFSDTQQPYNCPGPAIGAGSSAEIGVFSADKKYIEISCSNGGNRIINFNPVTLQVATVNTLTTSAVTATGSQTVNVGNTTYMTVGVPVSVDIGASQEFVVPTAIVTNTSFTAIFGFVHGSGAKVTSQGYVAGWTGTQCTYCLPGSGEFDSTAAGTFYSLNGLLIQKYVITNALVGAPTTVADLSYGPPCWRNTCGDWASGTYNTGVAIVPLTNNSSTDVFHLMNINGLPCTTSGTYPNFNSTTNTIITDGTCSWLNIGPKNISSGTFVTHSYPGLVSASGQQWSAGIANYQGDGGLGSMHVIMYNAATQTYYYMNTATGAIWNNVCTGGTGPTCTGGSFSGPVFQSFMIPGSANCTPAGPSCQDLTLIHNVKNAKDGIHITYGPQKCAFATIQCPSAGGGQIYFWNTIAGTEYWPNVAPGHHATGYNYVFAESGYTVTNPYYYAFGIPFTSTGTVQKYFKINQTPPALCSPVVCPNDPPFDQHWSAVGENSTDTTAICGAALSNNYGNWPYNYPYFGGVFCYATDGSNNVWQQALSYNSNGNVGFNTWANIGGLSYDMSLWGQSTDWFNTLGSRSGGASCNGGFNWQPGHTYNSGDLIAPGTNNAPAAGASTFTATSCVGGTCTTSSKHPVWPTGVGSQVTEFSPGTITWTNTGTNTCAGTVVIYRLN